ncbi:hypothetical protein L207DRAFT_75491 [Hyaloscypha variabilis F]|uniref:Uncharacterized protein n=1 Tax=Hyaloscypha variabilis (strain UAMH 11265 / GT02V1 / F) TaxID=1149755 RepID=A0A2J6RFV9_HYAVF|nr:hypothetical protein L207DRAFT_75491 [Hyaloscypha variabilis F]
MVLSVVNLRIQLGYWTITLSAIAIGHGEQVVNSCHALPTSFAEPLPKAFMPHNPFPLSDIQQSSIVMFLSRCSNLSIASYISLNIRRALNCSAHVVSRVPVPTQRNSRSAIDRWLTSVQNSNQFILYDCEVDIHCSLTTTDNVEFKTTSQALSCKPTRPHSPTITSI